MMRVPEVDARLKEWRASIDSSERPILAALLERCLELWQDRVNELTESEESDRHREFEETFRWLPVEKGSSSRLAVLLKLSERMDELSYEERAGIVNDNLKGKPGRPPDDNDATIQALEMYWAGVKWPEVADKLCPDDKHIPHSAANATDVDNGQERHDCTEKWRKRAERFQQFLDKYGWQISRK